MLGKLQYEVNEFSEAFCGNISYEDSVSFEVFVAEDKEEAFINKITDKTNATVKIEIGRVEFFEV